jgi:uncharacterized protein (TIGR02265 family)
MKPGFEKIDWAAPLDVDAYVAHCPPEAKVKGVIVNGVLKRLETMGKPPPPGVGRYLAFKDYPLREHMKITADVAQLAFPHEHLRESLRRLGHETFPAVKETLIGKVVFAAWDKPESVFKLSAKAYEIVGSIARVTVVESGPGFVHQHIVNAYGFLDSFQVGVTEGVLLAFKKEGAVQIKRVSLSEAHVYTEW